MFPTVDRSQAKLRSVCSSLVPDSLLDCGITSIEAARTTFPETGPWYMIGHYTPLSRTTSKYS